MHHHLHNRYIKVPVVVVVKPPVMQSVVVGHKLFIFTQGNSVFVPVLNGRHLCSLSLSINFVVVVVVFVLLFLIFRVTQCIKVKLLLVEQ